MLDYLEQAVEYLVRQTAEIWCYCYDFNFVNDKIIEKMLEV